MNGMSVRNGGMKFLAGENGRKSEKNLPTHRFVHHETHMGDGKSSAAGGGDHLTQ